MLQDQKTGNMTAGRNFLAGLAAGVTEVIEYVYCLNDSEWLNSTLVE